MCDFAGTLESALGAGGRAFKLEALRESKELFRRALENATVGMAHTKVDGLMLHVNDRFCKITGYSRRELLGRKFPEITHPECVQTDERLLQRIMAGELSTYDRENGISVRTAPWRS